MQMPLDTLPDASFRQEGHVSKAAEYRTNAEICRRMADKAQNEEDRRAWLEMAQSWSFLTKLDDVVPSERSSAIDYETNPFSAAKELYASAWRSFSGVISRPKTTSHGSGYTLISNLPKAFARIAAHLKAKLDSAYNFISNLLK